MSDMLCKLIGFGNEVGTVTNAMMSDGNYLSVSGKTADGKDFNISFYIEEEKKND